MRNTIRLSNMGKRYQESFEFTSNKKVRFSDEDEFIWVVFMEHGEMVSKCFTGESFEELTQQYREYVKDKDYFFECSRDHVTIGWSVMGRNDEEFDSISLTWEKDVMVLTFDAFGKFQAGWIDDTREAFMQYVVESKIGEQEGMFCIRRNNNMFHVRDVEACKKLIKASIDFEKLF